jgi:peptidoglycan/LPS O-acetylase OafA/YrhL
VTYGLAFLSWRLIERPALAYKRIVAPRREKQAGSEAVPAGAVAADG